MPLGNVTGMAKANYLIKGVVALLHGGVTDVRETDSISGLFRTTDIVSGET
jgi:hypothetical protein